MTMNEMISITDLELHSELKNLVADERRVSLAILKCLIEAENRNLPLRMGYSGLFHYCVAELGYSEAGASKRIAAARLITEIPKLEQLLNQGKLNFTTVSLAKTYFESEEKNGNSLASESKFEVLQSLCGLPTREAHKKLAALNPGFLPAERTRIIGPNETEIRFVADDELMKKLQRLKDLLSHQLRSSPTYRNLFHLMSDLAIRKLDPTLRQGRQIRQNDPNARFIPAHL
ncbi:MAG: hypothetical protein ACXWPM_07835, partial [Bdellovibrionota bacterium]